MAPNTVTILTDTCVIEASNLTLRLKTLTYSGPRNKPSQKHALYPKNRASISVQTLGKRSKQPKSTKFTASKNHLSSKDFLKKADRLWRAGPAVKYKDPDAWQKAIN
jgi:hypothetical protein